MSPHGDFDRMGEAINLVNRYGHPNKEVLNVLDYSKIYRTDEDGSIMLKIKNNRFKIEACSPQVL